MYHKVNFQWGSSLKRVHVTFIRSVLHYGGIAYGLTAKSLIGNMDVIQAQALKVCCLAFKTSPVLALQVEMEEMPLALKRKQLMANCWTNLQGHKNSQPTVDVLQECWENARFKKNNFGRIGSEAADEIAL